MAAQNRRNKAASEKKFRFKKPKGLASLAAPVTFFIVVVAIIFVMSVFFRVSDIQVEGNTHYTDMEIIRAIDIEQGDNLFFYDRFAAISRVFAKLPYIEQVSVDRSLPNKVKITVVESEALAYLELGEENWTLDHKCKVLGKAAEGETEFLIPVEGIKPGTLLIGEDMTTEDGNTELVAQLSEILSQLEDRGLHTQTRRVDFSDPDNVEFSYGGRYTVVLGGPENIEHKFGMFVSVMQKLKPGDVGIIDVSDITAAHFSPN